MKVYIMLAISIITEVFAASMLKMTNGLTNLMPLVGTGVGYAISFSLLGIILKYMPLSIAYAIWAGAGTVLTAIVSVVFWGEVFTILKIIGVVSIVMGIIWINLHSTGAKETV